MDMTRKAQRAKEALASIIGHDDEPVEVRAAVLAVLADYIGKAEEGMRARMGERAAAAAKAAANVTNG